MTPKVILYHPKSNPGGKAILPMPLLAVGSMLENEFDYTIVDSNTTPDALRVMDDLIREQGYNVVGTTVMPGPQLVEAVNDTRELKKRQPHVQMVWGGYFPTQHGDTILKADYVDYTVHSQGEITFLELLRTLRDGGDLGAIKGISYKENVDISPRRTSCPIGPITSWRCRAISTATIWARACSNIIPVSGVRSPATFAPWSACRTAAGCPSPRRASKRFFARCTINTARTR